MDIFKTFLSEDTREVGFQFLSFVNISFCHGPIHIHMSLLDVSVVVHLCYENDMIIVQSFQRVLCI